MTARTHGATGTRLYRAWQNMRARCYRKSSREYNNYGGMGISVCDEWRYSFENFRDWAILNGYDENLTLDRRNTDLNYCPDNCRWITNKEQQNNKRCNRNITYNGVTKTLQQWADEKNIGYKTLQGRIDSGWSIENALNEPVAETNLVDISGMRFGRITVINLAHTKHGAHWNCVCDCGKHSVVRGSNLTSGLTKSCGCLVSDRSKEAGKYVGSIKSEQARKIIVIQLDSEFNEISKFHGYIEASEQTGICKSTIIRATHSNFKNRAGGYYWKVGDDLSS